MPTKKGLDSMGATKLAVLCRKVAENPSLYSAPGSAKALKLMLEWNRQQTPPAQSHKQQQAIEEKKINLKKRMAEFLTGIL
jgi:hypothetical protein